MVSIRTRQRGENEGIACSQPKSDRQSEAKEILIDDPVTRRDAAWADEEACFRRMFMRHSS
jgi:hypothetical protein